jgi:hypothetical protein
MDWEQYAPYIMHVADCLQLLWLLVATAIALAIKAAGWLK